MATAKKFLAKNGIQIRPETSGTTSGTIAPNAAITDHFNLTGISGAITLTTPSGTPTDGQKLLLKLEDNGTAAAITWTTASGGYRGVGNTLPTTTVAGKTLYIGCIYNAMDLFWDVVAVAQQG
jgi:hypothetical protein